MADYYIGGFLTKGVLAEQICNSVDTYGDLLELIVAINYQLEDTEFTRMVYEWAKKEVRKNA